MKREGQPSKTWQSVPLPVASSRGEIGLSPFLSRIVFTWLLLDEGFSPAQAIAYALVIAGIATVSRSQS